MKIRPRRIFSTLIWIVILVGAGYVAAMIKGASGPPIITVAPGTTATPKPTPIPTANVATWKDYVDATYKVSIKHPAEWPGPLASAIKKSTAAPVANDLADFTDSQAGSAVPTRQLYFSSVAAYKGTALETAVAQLGTVYTSKEAEVLNPPVLLPSVSAGSLLAASKPFYVETSDGTFRGVGFYGFIGSNGLPSNGDALSFDHLVMIMGDGQDRIIQLVVSDHSGNATYSDLNACTPAVGNKLCRINTTLQHDEVATYEPLMQSLKAQ